MWRTAGRRPANTGVGQMDEHVSHATEHAELKRGIGPWLLFFFVLGDIVGAGIYALVGEVGAVVGGAIWAAFLFSFILAIFTAASYAELVTKYPRAGGAATYVNSAFRMPFVSFMVAFAVMAAGITSACTLTLAFSGDYLSQFVGIPSIIAAVVFMIALGLINFYGISESVKINVLLTCVEITGLLLITLIGFDDSVNVAEETRHPSRNYPRAMFGGLLVAGVIYLFVTFTASMVVPTADLAASSGPLLEVVERGTLTVPSKLFAAIALLAVSNGALINLIMASRITYGMADQGVLPSVFARVHENRRTPWVAILFVTTIGLIMLVSLGSGALDTLSTTTVVLLLMAFIMVNASVLALRGDHVEHEHFRTPTVFPILGILVSLVLLIYSAVNDITIFVLAGVLLLLGVVLYGVDVLAKSRLDRTRPEAREGGPPETRA